MLPTNDLPYTLWRDGVVVKEGRFPEDGWGPMGSQLFSTTITTTVTGHYSLTVPFTYTLGTTSVVTGHAQVIADFDTSHSTDKDPPAILNLWLLADGTLTDQPYGSPEVLVTLTDTVGVAGASLFYNVGAGWIEVSPAVQIPNRIGDDYSWHVPAQTPSTWVALRLRAWDAASNTLIYELWPAYVQAPYRYWFPLALKDAAP